MNLPDPEPAVPCFYERQIPAVPPYKYSASTDSKIGYSMTPPTSRVVSFDRTTHTLEQALEKFTLLRAKHGWRLVGEIFWTARRWCWRIISPR